MIETSQTALRQVIPIDKGTRYAIAVLLCIGIAVYILFIYNPRPTAVAAPDDPYIDFQLGETEDLWDEHNVSCLNQRLPDGVKARWENDTGTERINFTHKVVYWEAQLVLQRVEQQTGVSPSVVRVHEDTVRSCEAEIADNQIEGETYIYETIPHKHAAEDIRNTSSSEGEQ